MRSLVVVLAACTANEGTSTAQHGACTSVESYTFASMVEMECGLTPNGVALCPWRIAFEPRDNTASDFEWSYSDVVESGSVQCDGNDLETVNSSWQHAGTYDPATYTLVWDGASYARQ
jgi:hypothetical protein